MSLTPSTTASNYYIPKIQYRIKKVEKYILNEKPRGFNNSQRDATKKTIPPEDSVSYNDEISCFEVCSHSMCALHCDVTNIQFQALPH